MKSGLTGKKILITSGPTSVAIDEMRVLTNRSTGEMGRLLANACVRSGARVTLLEGAVTTAVALDKRVLVRKFFLFDELESLFKGELQKKPYAVIHAAAVSDFRPEKIFKGKVPSGDQLTLNLVPTRKLIGAVKKLAPKTFLVGFKFEPSLMTAVDGADRLIEKSGCDLVVANSLEDGEYRALLVERECVLRKPFASKGELVLHLTSFLCGLSLRS